MKLKSALMAVLVFAAAVRGAGAADTVSSVPKILWGKYCPEGFRDCSPREFYIEAKRVWSESHGGCAQVNSVEVQNDTFHLSCEDKSHVILQRLSKKKIRITVAGDEPIILQKLK